MRAIEAIVAEGKARPKRPSEGRSGPQTSAPCALARISFETTPQVAALLDELAASGLYPPTREGTAEEILRTALREIERAKGGR